MLSTLDVLVITHLFGLVLGVGAATVKVALLLKTKSDSEFISAYLQVVKPVTKLLVLGLVILTLSGIIWVLNGYYFTPLLTAKTILVGLVWVLGPIIDKVAEPTFLKFAPLPGEAASVEFVHARKQYLTLELGATSLFYVITVMGVLL